MKSGIVALLICSPGLALAAVLWWPAALAVGGVMLLAYAGEKRAAARR